MATRAMRSALRRTMSGKGSSVCGRLGIRRSAAEAEQACEPPPGAAAERLAPDLAAVRPGRSEELEARRYARAVVRGDVDGVGDVAHQRDADPEAGALGLRRQADAVVADDDL